MRRQGRPLVTRLTLRQTKATVRLIVERWPDQLRLPFALWTREAVQMSLENTCPVRVSVWTVGRYLQRWGLTPQKPLQRAFEQDPEAVRGWLGEEFPRSGAGASRKTRRSIGGTKWDCARTTRPAGRTDRRARPPSS